ILFSLLPPPPPIPPLFPYTTLFRSNENGVIDIRNGRHPVVEQMIENDMFIANDTYLDSQKKRVSVITGPNMAGKSTYMRQTALKIGRAHVGSFVPARSEERRVGKGVRGA